jgi:4-hydroxy-tetrahydrodipicolinate synthase
MFEGAITAIVTPFDENGKIDEEALRKLVDVQIDSGIKGIVPVGTTGESPTLDHDEHNKVVDIVIDAVKGRVPVIAGTGSNSTEEAIAMTKHAKEAGATASLQVAPYYNKPTQKGFYEHFIAIADAVDLPMVVYNIPGRTGKNIETSTMMKLAKHKNIVAVKEASGDLNQMMDVIAQKPDDFAVLSGDDNMTVPLMLMGGKGVISVASNIIPKDIVAMADAALNGDIKTAVETHYKLLPFCKAMFIETNPIPIKTALAMKGMIKENFRLPMCEMEPENKEKLKKILQDFKVL